MPLDSQNEANALRAMLGLPSAPVFLDIKPPDLLTDRERDQLTRRLREIESVPPVPWWKFWRRF
jgi:hypothetical protein